MVRSTTEKAAGVDRGKPQLDAFLGALGNSNPFIAARVNEPSRYDIDVPGIHAEKFVKLVSLAGQAKKDGKGVGVVLLGGAGVGKSHLLSRLYRWAIEGGEQDRPRACYVFLHNILADPDRLPRYLLKCVVSLLSKGGRGPLDKTPLFRLVHEAVLHALKQGQGGGDQVKLNEAAEAYRSAFGRMSGSPEVYDVLFQFFKYAYPRQSPEPTYKRLAMAALAWLSGEEIDADAATRLGLKVEGQESAALADDQAVEQVLLALANLARIRDQPFVLCIDQVDNLDPDKLKALSRFLHALLDHASNMLVIVSGVKENLLKNREDGTISHAAWDRIAEYKVELPRVRKDDARKILEARLERFHEPFIEFDPVRLHLQQDTLFPLGRTWLADRLGDAREVRARDIIIWARDAWEDEQTKLKKLGGEDWLKKWPHVGKVGDGDGPESIEDLPSLEETIDAMVARKVEEQVAQRRLQPGSLPPDAGNLAGLVLALLEQCRGEGKRYTFRDAERVKGKNGRMPPYDVRVREHREQDAKDITTGVVFVTNSGRSATEALKRLLNDEPPPHHRLLVTDQERRPLKMGEQGVAYYRDLEKLGKDAFEHIKLDFEQYAALDALEAVVGLARVGDVDVEWPRGTIRPVTEAEVVASNHRKGRYLQHPLLRHLLSEDHPVGQKPPVYPPPDPLLDKQFVRQYIMAQLAWRLGMSAQELTTYYIMTPPVMKIPPDKALEQVKQIANEMHQEQLIHATPTDNDLFLQCRT